jgi:hypothetical protein
MRRWKEDFEAGGAVNCRISEEGLNFAALAAENASCSGV